MDEVADQSIGYCDMITNTNILNIAGCTLGDNDMNACINTITTSIQHEQW